VTVSSILEDLQPKRHNCNILCKIIDQHVGFMQKETSLQAISVARSREYA